MSLTITRDDLRTITEQTITPYRDLLTDEQVATLRVTADTVTSVMMGSWRSLKTGCGCLVGTAYPALVTNIQTLEEDHSSLYLVGVRFDELLNNHFGVVHEFSVATILVAP